MRCVVVLSGKSIGSAVFRRCVCCLFMTLPAIVLSGCPFYEVPYYIDCLPDLPVWGKTYIDADDVYYGRDAAELANGDLLILGHNDSRQAALLTTDADGNRRWISHFGTGEESMYGVKVVAMPDGGNVVLANAGYAFDAFGRADYYLMRSGNSGSRRWERRFGSERNDAATDLALVDGDLVVLGSSQRGETGDWDVQLYRFDTEGNELWSYSFGGDSDDMAAGLAVARDGGFAMLAHSETPGGAVDSYLVTKTNGAGVQQWQSTFPGPGGPAANIRATGDGGYIVAGNTSRAPYLLKLNSAGEQVWTRTLPVAYSRSVAQMLVAEDGGFLLTGVNDDACFAGAYLTKTDAEGRELWTRDYGPYEQYTYGYGLTALADGTYLLTGDVEGFTIFPEYVEFYGIYVAKVRDSAF